jgi:THO complex subunit 3
MEMMSDLEELRAHFKNHNRVREVQAHSAKVHTVDWNRDGRRLASGSFDKTVCIFIVDNERLVCTLLFTRHFKSLSLIYLIYQL